MSVIAAISSSKFGSTWIGSDTMVCSGELKLTNGPKWIVREPWAAGVAGHLRTINVLQHHADELLRNLPDAYEFSRRARDLLKLDGYGEGKDTDGPPQFGQMIILARPAAVWTVGADFSVMPIPMDKLWAEGSGRDLAIGAAHALLSVNAGISERDVVRHAVETAIIYDSNCGGSPWLAELAGPGPRAGV
jgi:ATP-dependent protease HslVU (ClpYQ) peptidase subunit